MLWSFPFLALALGLILGSFYNVCIHRYLSGESIVFPASKCPKCSHKLRWYENIPVLSWVLLRGKCSNCKQSISLRYPIVELTSGVWAMALAVKYGPTGAWGVYMVIGAIFIIASFIDFQEYILPDILTLPGAGVALAGAYFVLQPQLGGPTLSESLIGMVAGAGALLALRQTYMVLKGIEGLGMGDVKLMLMIGAILGWQALPAAVTAGAIIALPISIIYMRMQPEKGMKAMVPFGPFLSLGCMLYILFGDWFMGWYLSYAGLA